MRASFLEAARLFRKFMCVLLAIRYKYVLTAAGFMMIRDVEEDLVLHNTGSNGDDTLSLQRGTRVVVDMVGLRAFSVHATSIVGYDIDNFTGRLQSTSIS